MAFCINCGNPIVDGAKFCHNCGASQTGTTNNTQRKTVYEGEIHKCPNCGETIDSFTPKCPSCGFEFRGVKPVSSVQELSIRLANIDQQRRFNNRRKSVFNSREPDEIDKQKIDLISTFPIPNTKEDLYEFIILAASNIDKDAYGGYYTRELAISKAWETKLDQAYQKSTLIFTGDSRLAEIQSIYERSQREIKKSKRHVLRELAILFGILYGIVILLFVILSIVNPIRDQNETSRLEAIVVDIEAALENGEYSFALMQAESIEYHGNNDELKRQWDIQREYLIEKVLKEAAANGVILEYTPKEDADSVEESTTSERNGGFVQGFIDGFNSAFDS